MNWYISNHNSLSEYIENSHLLRHVIKSVFGSVLEKEHMNKAIDFLASLEDRKDLISAVDECRDSIGYKCRFRDLFKI
jgi:hypothetical protein